MRYMSLRMTAFLLCVLAVAIIPLLIVSMIRERLGEHC